VSKRPPRLKQIGKFTIPAREKFALPGDAKPWKELERQRLYEILAAFYVCPHGNEGLLELSCFDISLPVVLGHEYGLESFRDLRQLGYIKQSRYHDMPFELVTAEEREANESVV
jgi:hypothetical protein